VRVDTKQKKTTTTKLKRNPDFVGVQQLNAIRADCTAFTQRHGCRDVTQLRTFAAKQQWKKFGPRYSHYDWWMFPIATPSSFMNCVVWPGDVADLRADAAFLRSYREGVELVTQSWGWDIARARPVEQKQRHADQRWKNWPVRLAKCAQSLYEFGEMQLFNALRPLGVLLHEQKQQAPHSIDFGAQFSSNVYKTLMIRS
jgi:hypothetical protein